jgi:hypothetical protein
MLRTRKSSFSFGAAMKNDCSRSPPEMFVGSSSVEPRKLYEPVMLPE